MRNVFVSFCIVTSKFTHTLLYEYFGAGQLSCVRQSVSFMAKQFISVWQVCGKPGNVSVVSSNGVSELFLSRVPSHTVSHSYASLSLWGHRKSWKLPKLHPTMAQAFLCTQWSNKVDRVQVHYGSP